MEAISIIDLIFLGAIATCAIGLIICGILLFVLSIKDFKETNKKGYIHPSIYNKNYKEPLSTLDRILHRRHEI